MGETPTNPLFSTGSVIDELLVDKQNTNVQFLGHKL